MGAGSVAVSARPTLPKTEITSGKPRSTRSWRCSDALASSMEMPGKVVGMKSTSPSFRGGMNSLPSRRASGTAERMASSPSATVVLGQRRATKTKGL